MNGSLVGHSLPPKAILGGLPTPTLDVPVAACFLALFILGGSIHFGLHHINSKKGHKFHLSGLMFDFSLVRILTCIMRIVWAFRPDNKSVMIGALIFENAGVVVLFAVNAVFTQRIIRAIHPRIGWSSPLNRFFFLVLISIPFIIVYNILFTILSFYVVNTETLSCIRGLLLFGSFYTTALSLLPIILVTLAAIIPTSYPIEKFATGRFRSKIIILIFASAILFAGALVRLISAMLEYPKESPHEVNSKIIFYTTGFTLEIIVVVMYAIMRVDLRFWVPDGCGGPGDYLCLENGEKAFNDITIEQVDLKFILHPEVDRQDWFKGLLALPTRKEVREGVYELGFKPKLICPPIDAGNSEILVYAFRVRKLGIRCPNRSSKRPLSKQTWGDTFSLDPFNGLL